MASIRKLLRNKKPPEGGLLGNKRAYGFLDELYFFNQQLSLLLFR
jgi:hypothetical protein